MERTEDCPIGDQVINKLKKVLSRGEMDECLENIDALCSPDGDWIEAVRDMKVNDYYDRFIIVYSKVMKQTEDDTREIFDNIEANQAKRPEFIERSDHREEPFLEYNKENIMINLTQIEQHLRDLPDEESDHAQCINKHSLMVQGELDEAISHTASVEPQNVDFYRTLKEEIMDFRKEMGGRSMEENLQLIREIRKGAETMDPEKYDTSKCKACGAFNLTTPDEPTLSDKIEKQTSIIKEKSLIEKRKIRKIIDSTGNKDSITMVDILDPLCLFHDPEDSDD